jgi:hypothetical protein
MTGVIQNKLIIREFNVRDMIVLRDGLDCVDLYLPDGDHLGEINPVQAKQIAEFCMAIWVRHVRTMRFDAKEDDSG